MALAGPDRAGPRWAVQLRRAREPDGPRYPQRRHACARVPAAHPRRPGPPRQWVLRPIRGGTATRLVSRQRNTHPRGQRMLWRLVEPIGFVMERRMLLGIKER